MKIRDNKELFGCLMLLLAAIVWGFGVPIQSISAKTLGANTVVFFKALGTILLIPISIKLKQHFTKETFIYGILMGAIMYFSNFSQQKGIETSSAGKVSFITALYTVFVPVIGVLFFKRKTKSIVWLSVGIAYVGMYLLCINGEFILSVGDIWLLLGAIAGFLVLNERLSLKEVLGCVLIFVAVFIAIKAEEKKC